MEEEVDLVVKSTSLTTNSHTQPLLETRTLPSVALGKVHSATYLSAKGLCRVLFIGALGKIFLYFVEGRHATFR
jgi:hypothetical protein